ncbi:dihydroneopterin aldolase [Corynebacterium sp. 320]|uniref:7,8-dihydroneopterin aldolase n=1 Tax=Corynebacterium zhongnanshanii TaxID=2768834 RepID=A0ABQ6VC91_9CORY|nr:MULTISPECIES: dihydroneopterin aldolase [Corynebacterium]KAB1503063.1 dihydroneopterin aldolase [Corynebacterium sp. 320]KAB1550726.1 dihydroneopterin aldolase [Corynebacterium sp. 321]KAB1551085.1 dihydroneopterin aldolase [Corynebacterium sp. 319]KAB3519857.1 dihydroneopterin aldolase [Corynebacterium zhongnanshanii]KAB3526860.1 dihydroneopterin aldolase [Corynebacterium sp. 250]
MADRIELMGVEAFGYHGVYEHEKKAGQKFVVDIVVWTDFRTAADTDRLGHTISYVDLAKIAVDAIEGEPFDLIETLASRIAERIQDIEGVLANEVTVHKPQAPINYPFADVRVVARRSGKTPTA